MQKENLKEGLRIGLIGFLILLGIVVASLLLGDTGLDYAYSLDEDLHNQVSITWNEGGGPAYATYRNEKYIYVGEAYAFVYRASRHDELLSWNGFRWGLWYITEFYSDRIDDPVFIYTEDYAFFHEDFDYTSEAYVTLEEGYRFVFCDELTLLDSIPFSYSLSTTYMRNTNVTLCSESNERIQIRGHLFRYDSVWYFGLDGQRVLFQASDEFVHGVSDWPDV